MSKGDQQVQQQTQQSVSSPWGPAQGTLENLLSGYGGINTGVTGAQSGALSNLQSAANLIPNFGQQGTDALSKMFNFDTAPQVGLLQQGYGDLTKNLGATASGAELNPYSTPGFSDALNTLTNNITNSVKGVYAGAGRDPSGAGSFAKSLGLGLLQGTAPVLQSQYNTNKQNQMNAASTLYNAAGSTASGITGQQTTPLSIAAQAFGLAPQIGSLFTAPAQTQLNAANAAYNLPISNLNAVTSPVAQIGSLGGQTQGSSTGTVTQPQSTLSNVLGGVSTGIGLLSFLSDARAKEDVEEVGKLHDGQKVYSFRYKGQPGTQIGLLAQEVAEKEPDAVSQHPVGLLQVDYRKATRRAAHMRRAA